MEGLAVVWHVVVGLTGAALVVGTALSAVKTVVLPRAAVTRTSRLVFLAWRRIIDLVSRPSRPAAERDAALALYAPLALVSLPGVWVVMMIAGYACVFWSLGVAPFDEAVITSGSSLLTLGFVRAQSDWLVLVEFSAAILGLGIVSLMISYLPTIYGSFARRETLVGTLEVRAGTPPSAVVLFTRYQRIGRSTMLASELFPDWERWFAEIEESHTSQPSLVFFRSPQPGRSWITAAGCVLDAAALYASALDVPRDAQAQLLLRTGFMSLRRIADFFGIEHPADPQPDDPISIRRHEFDAVLDELADAGLPVLADRDQAWRDFAGWRVNYDTVLLSLCALVVAPPAPWSSDRMPARRPRVRLRTRMRRSPTR